jgi:hypothetical protein
MDPKQQERFREALDRKEAEAEAASHNPRQEPGAGGVPGDRAELSDTAHEQDDFSVRDKNSRHGKVTADKWNQ